MIQKIRFGLLLCSVVALVAAVLNGCAKDEAATATKTFTLKSNYKTS